MYMHAYVQHTYRYYLKDINSVAYAWTHNLKKQLCVNKQMLTHHCMKNCIALNFFIVALRRCTNYWAQKNFLNIAFEEFLCECLFYSVHTPPGCCRGRGQAQLKPFSQFPSVLHQQTE